jgi:hypothetical protein
LTRRKKALPRTTLLAHFEGLPAAAAALGVWVRPLEAVAHAALLLVENRALQKLEAAVVDHHREAVEIEHEILFRPDLRREIIDVVVAGSAALDP